VVDSRSFALSMSNSASAGTYADVAARTASAFRPPVAPTVEPGNGCQDHLNGWTRFWMRRRPEYR